MEKDADREQWKGTTTEIKLELGGVARVKGTARKNNMIFRVKTLVLTF